MGNETTSDSTDPANEMAAEGGDDLYLQRSRLFLSRVYSSVEGFSVDAIPDDVIKAIILGLPLVMQNRGQGATAQDNELQIRRLSDWLEGKSAIEIAEADGITESAVFKGRKKIARKLGQALLPEELKSATERFNSGESADKLFVNLGLTAIKGYDGTVKPKAQISKPKKRARVRYSNKSGAKPLTSKEFWRSSTELSPPSTINLFPTRKREPEPLEVIGTRPPFDRDGKTFTTVILKGYEFPKSPADSNGTSHASSLKASEDLGYHEDENFWSRTRYIA